MAFVRDSDKERRLHEGGYGSTKGFIGLKKRGKSYRRKLTGCSGKSKRYWKLASHNWKELYVEETTTQYRSPPKLRSPEAAPAGEAAGLRPELPRPPGKLRPPRQEHLAGLWRFPPCPSPHHSLAIENSAFAW